MARKVGSKFLSKQEFVDILNGIGKGLRKVLSFFIFIVIPLVAIMLAVTAGDTLSKHDFELIRGVINYTMALLVWALIVSIILLNAVSRLFKIKDNLFTLGMTYFIAILYSGFIFFIIPIVKGEITPLVLGVFTLGVLVEAISFYISKYRIKTFFEVEVK